VQDQGVRRHIRVERFPGRTRDRRVHSAVGHGDRRIGGSAAADQEEGRDMELVENRETVGVIAQALAAGRSLPAVAAELGLSIQALREVLARNALAPARA
jgi:hypothetical protein